MAVVCATIDLIIPVPDPEASVFLRHAFPVLSLLVLAAALPEPLGDFLPRRGGRIIPARATVAVGMELVVTGTWVLAVVNHADSGRISSIYAIGLGVTYALATVTQVGSWVSALFVGAVSLLPGRVIDPLFTRPETLPVAIGIACVGLVLFIACGAVREAPVVR